MLILLSSQPTLKCLWIRFNGKNMYKTSTGLALKKTEQEINKAFSEASPYAHAGGNNQAPATEEKKGVYKHLMTGVSHMLPVVVAGGLIIALSFVFGIEAFKEEGVSTCRAYDHRWWQRVCTNDSCSCWFHCLFHC